MKKVDTVKKWLIKNIIIPNINVFDKPGFIITKFSDKGKNVFLREIFIPEKLLVEIEKIVVEKHKDDGKKILYSLGKKFGYRYAALSKFSQITKVDKKEFLRFADLTIKYIGSIWAENIDYELDYNKKNILFKMKDFIICSENGLGYILSSGGIAGVWAFAVDDITVEGIHIKCQGNGYDKCTVICAPEKELEQYNFKHFTETDINYTESNEKYNVVNNIRETVNNKSSFKLLLDSNIFKYDNGSVTIQNERFFDFECGLFYLIESELSKIKNGKNILFEESFKFGRSLQKKTNGDVTFIANLLSALGWGDILIITKNGKYDVILDYFPWSSDYSSKIEYIIPKGILSGFISGFKKDDKFKLNSHKINVDNNGFKLILSE